MSMRFLLFRYSLEALLFVVLCVAAVMTGSRLGFENGYLAGQQQRLDEEYVSRAYSLAELNGRYSFTEVEKLVKDIHPTTWQPTGGPGLLHVLHDREKNAVFVVNQTRKMHEAIESLLANLRAASKPHESDKSH